MPDKLPGIHVYVAAPEPVSEVLPPLQIVASVAVAVTVGGAPTTTVTCAVLEQPADVPVIVYVVVEPGVTVCVAPFRLPGIQLYVVAPPPVNVTELPVQMDELEEVAVTVGVGFTVMVRVAGSVHPFAAVPVTVYVVVVVGETVTVVPDKLPGIQL